MCAKQYVFKGQKLFIFAEGVIILVKGLLNVLVLISSSYKSVFPSVRNQSGAKIIYSSGPKSLIESILWYIIF